MTIAGLLLLVGSSWTLGASSLRWIECKDLRPFERGAITLLAGLGLTSLVLALLTLAGGFRSIIWALITLSLPAAFIVARNRRVVARAVSASPSRAATILALVAVTLSCIG